MHCNAEQSERSDESCKGDQTRVVKAPFFKANLKAVSKRLIKAVKRLLYVVNKTNDCFKMHLTSVHLRASNFQGSYGRHYTLFYINVFRITLFRHYSEN